MQSPATPTEKFAKSNRSARLVDVFAAAALGKKNVEENTSKVYVASSGLMAGALSPTANTGSPLFLINLCASMAPVQLASKSLPGLEAYRLYQVTRVEDGRTRYRLRLGFFATQVEAEEVLARVREQYPTAFTACMCEEDRRHTRGYVVGSAPRPNISVVSSNPPKAAVAAPRVPVAAAKPAPATAQATPKPTPATKAAAPPSTTTSTRSVTAAPAPAASHVIEISRQPAAATKPVAGKQGPAKSNIQIDSFEGLEGLSWDDPSLTAASAPAKEATGKHAARTVAAGVKTQPVIKAEPPKAASPSPATKPPHKIDTAASMRVKALELTLSEPPPPPAAKSASTPPSQPFHVGKGINIPTVELSLHDTATLPKPQTPAASAAKSTLAQKPAIQPKAAPTQAPIQAKAPPPATKAPAPAAKPNGTNPDLDSTQTIRALTSEELADETQEKWFAIQLAASEQPVNLDAMPHLDIFEAYRLYSIAIAGSGKIIHSLRLGFFKEAASAEAVAGYLNTFFGSPSVVRISAAEQERFKDSTMPKKPAAPEPKAKPNVVELNSARTSRPPVPTVTMEVARGSQDDTSATGSFRMNSSGTFRTSETAKHRTLTTPGAVKPAAKYAAPATKRSAPPSNTSMTGRYKIPPKKSLAQELLEEAKEVQLSKSGLYKMPKNDSSLLSRLVDKLKK